MVKNAAYPVRCAVKKRWENYADKSLIHAAKVIIYFGFRMFDFGFFLILNSSMRNPSVLFDNLTQRAQSMCCLTTV